MSRTLTARQHRIASAVCQDSSHALTQGEIAAQVGVHPSGLSTTIKKLSVQMGLVEFNDTSHVSRLRLVIR